MGMVVCAEKDIQHAVRFGNNAEYAAHGAPLQDSLFDRYLVVRPEPPGLIINDAQARIKLTAGVPQAGVDIDAAVRFERDLLGEQTLSLPLTAAEHVVGG